MPISYPFLTRIHRNDATVRSSCPLISITNLICYLSYHFHHYPTFIISQTWNPQPKHLKPFPSALVNSFLRGDCFQNLKWEDSVLEASGVRPIPASLHCSSQTCSGKCKRWAYKNIKEVASTFRTQKLKTKLSEVCVHFFLGFREIIILHKKFVWSWVNWSTKLRRIICLNKVMGFLRCHCQHCGWFWNWGYWFVVWNHQ